MAKTQRTQKQIEAEFTAWLAGEGKQEILKAMERAKATSDEFARSTRVRTETLYEPVAF